MDDDIEPAIDFLESFPDELTSEYVVFKKDLLTMDSIDGALHVFYEVSHIYDEIINYFKDVSEKDSETLNVFGFRDALANMVSAINDEDVDAFRNAASLAEEFPKIFYMLRSEHLDEEGAV